MANIAPDRQPNSKLTDLTYYARLHKPPKYGAKYIEAS